MGIRFFCPNGHKLNVKNHLAGQRGICPYCGVKVLIPLESTRSSDKNAAGHDDVGTSTVEASGGDRQAAATSIERSGNFSPATLSEGGREPSASGSETTTIRPDPVGARHGSQTDPPGLEKAVDPFAESPKAVWYVRPPGGGQFGPAEADTFRAWIAEGRVSADSLVWREGWGDWKQACQVFQGLAAARLTPVVPTPPLAASAPDSATEPSVAAADPRKHGKTYRRGSQRDSKNFAIVVLIVLVLAVVVLAVALIVVITRSPEDATEAMRPGRGASAPAAGLAELQPGEAPVWPVG